MEWFTAHYWEWILAGLYLLVGPITWGLLCFSMIKGRSRMEIVIDPPPPIPEPMPKVSVLIPAKDEVGQIEKCVRSVLNSDYPNLQIIVIDDRSTDGTGELLDRLAANDSRLQIIHIIEGTLPAGWGGKSFALHNGLKAADGDWLLFVDADVEIHPRSITATLAWAIKREFNLISLLPKFVSAKFSEGFLQPLAGAATSAMFAVPLTNSPQWPKTAFANGQFLLVKREAYEAVGGHEAIRGTLSEDVAIARRLKIAGLRPRISWGEQWATVRMYDGFAAIWRGWTRNFYVGSLGKPWRILGLIGYLLVCCASIIAAIAWGVHRQHYPINFLGGAGWIGSAIAHYLMMTAVVGLMYRWAYEPMEYALLFPIGVIFLLAVSVKSLWICATGKVAWRGTVYSAKTMDANAPQATTQ